MSVSVLLSWKDFHRASLEWFDVERGGKQMYWHPPEATSDWMVALWIKSTTPHVNHQNPSRTSSFFAMEFA